MQCQRCRQEQFVKAGRDRVGRQVYQCGACGRRQTERSASAFRGYRFPDDVIALAVRWYLRFRIPWGRLTKGAFKYAKRCGRPTRLRCHAHRNPASITPTS